MDILKVGALAILLHGVGYAEFLEVVGPPPLHLKQICEGILERGNVVWKYFEGMKTPGNCSTFEPYSDNWYIANNLDNVLYRAINNSCISPFLKYKYDEDNITSVGLLFNENVSVSNSMLQKAMALPAKIKHIAMPMKKLPTPIPNNWKANLLSLEAQGLRHIEGGAFYNSNMEAIDLSSIESSVSRLFVLAPKFNT
jgi:hypothetical protein